MATIIKCPMCGKEFEKTNAQKFCSATCRKRYNTEKARKKYYTSVKIFECGWCGLFFQSGKKEEYCCEECRQKGENRKRSRGRKSKNTLSLEAIAVAAHKEGLTYGQYVAKYGL